MKALIVGYGSIGKRHVKNLQKLNNSEIIIFTNKKNVNCKRCKIFNSFESCLKEKPDFAIISNVTSLHVKTAIKLANNGIDLFIEKPLSNNLKDIKKLQTISKKKKIITMVGCNLRFNHGIKKIKKMINSNKIGRVISVKVENGSYLPDWHPNEDYQKSYAGLLDLGGGVVLTCIHEIDYLYWIFGQVNEVFSITGKFSDLKINADDSSSILMRFKNNIIAEVHLDYYQRPEIRTFKIIGTKGTIYWNSNTNTVKIYNVKDQKWKNEFKETKVDENYTFVEELEHFIKSVKSRKETLNPLHEGIETLKISLKILQSSKYNRIVKS
jgi:predicted dehydrogenase